MKTSWNFSLPWESRFLPLKESNKLKKKEKGKHNSLQKLTHSFLHLPPLHHIPYSSSHLFIFSREKKNKTENIHTLKFLPYGLFHDGVHVTIVPWIPKKQIPKAWHSAKRETMRILSARVLKLITRTAIGRWSNECPPPRFSPLPFWIWRCHPALGRGNRILIIAGQGGWHVVRGNARFRVPRVPLIRI